MGLAYAPTGSVLYTAIVIGLFISLGIALAAIGVAAFFLWLARRGDDALESPDADEDSMLASLAATEALRLDAEWDAICRNGWAS